MNDDHSAECAQLKVQYGIVTTSRRVRVRTLWLLNFTTQHETWLALRRARLGGKAFSSEFAAVRAPADALEVVQP
jgi:hypothetical protein